MQTIKKTGSMPTKTAKAFQNYKDKPWGDIPEEFKTPLREELEREQKGVCCYCCKSLSNSHTTIEHLRSRQNYPNERFDYNNLLLSCTTKDQCDKAKGNTDLELTPLMEECDTEIQLNLAGELDSSTKRGQSAINLLNLNSRQMCQYRKNLFSMLGEVFGHDLPHSPPLAIQSQESLDEILSYLPDEGQKSEIKYIINKLT